MKKQVVSFLALFGLVFVLSIYYVLLPTNLFFNETVDDALNVNMSIDETSNLYFSTLDNKLEEKHASDLYSLECIVASSNYTNEEKEIALNSINSKLRIMNNEDYLVSLIKDQGYYNAYVEYLDDMIKVVVQTNELSNTQAAELITLVMENSINSLLPEVSYVM